MPTGNHAAFPAANQPGLTKREYFAGLFLQAMITRQTIPHVDQTAQAAVDAADALIKALELQRP